MKKLFTLGSVLFVALNGFAQDESKSLSIGVESGIINYLGDLNPNSFSFRHAHSFVSFYLTQPLTSKLNFRGGFSTGKIGASDKNNRGYLVPRNLDFQSDINELFGGFEWSAFDLEKVIASPYLFIGGAAFHFNPWTTDKAGNKVFLQPLGTEGQGLADYPSRQPYKLTQFAMIYGGGIRMNVNYNVSVGLEGSMRKTFTDYLDDVSTGYADHDKLLAAKGQQAVDLAFRGNELDASQPYPHAGDQRGTPTENDWYYMFGVNIQVKLSAIRDKLAKSYYGGRSRQGCPVNF
jgi:hypothetical protein